MQGISCSKLLIMKRLIHILPILVIVLLVLTCSDKEKSDDITQGIIVYNVSYLENTMAKSIPVNLLPKKMTLKFKDDKSNIGIEGFMGLFAVNIITDHKRGTSTTLMKVIGNKYKYESAPDESSVFFSEIPGMKIELRRGLKELATLVCKRGRVSFPSSEMEPFMFYYTNKVRILNPNQGNPYTTVDGVLMKFQVKLNKLRMELTADKVTEETIANDEFKIPDGYKKVSKKDMEDILGTLME